MSGYNNYSSFHVDGGEGARTIKQMMDGYYQQSYPINAAYWQEGLIDKRFKVGDQSLYASLYGEEDFYRHKRFFFNKIRRHVNMIIGFQRRNRKSMQSVSIEQENDDLSDQFTKALLHGERVSGFQEYFSQACEGATDVGISYLQCYLDYSRDPVNGEIAWDNVAYNNCLIDPYFRKSDFSDCNFWWRRKWVSKDIAKSLLPSRAKDIDKIRAQGAKDGRFPLQAELVQQQISSLLPYDEFYYRDTRKATMIVDRQNGDTAEWNGTKDELEQILGANSWLTKVSVDRATVKLAILVGNKVLYDGPNLLGTDRWPVVPVLGYYEPDLPSFSWRVQGVVRNLRDAQYLYNRRKVIELDVLESVANSGWIYKTDAVTDVKAFRQTGQGVLIPLRRGAEMSDIQRIEAPQVPASMIELSRALSEDITQISGVNEELLGAADDDKAGVLAMLRQGAGLTTLQTLFDRWDYSHNLCGQLMLETIQRNWTYGKAKRILGDEPNSRFFDAELTRYEVVIREGVYSATQRQMEAQQLMYVRNQMNIPIADKTIIRALQIQNKDELIKDLEEQQQQQAQQQEQMVRAQAQEAELRTQVEVSKAAANQALAQERQANVVALSADMAVKLSKSEKDEAEADLALVKQLVELDNLSMESLMRSIAMAKQIQQEGDTKQLPEGLPPETFPNPGVF